MRRALRKLSSWSSWIVLAVAVVGYLAILLIGQTDTPDELTLTELYSRVDAGRVQEATIDSGDHTVTVVLDDGAEFLVRFPTEYDDELTGKLTDAGVEVGAAKVGFWDDTLGQVIVTILPFGVIMIGVLAYFKIRANADVRKKRVTVIPTDRFDDVIGADEAVAELRQTVDILRNPRRYRAAGVQAIRGLLFHGPSGTGKTLLARAIAGEAGVPFFSVSGGGFKSKYYGVSGDRVRKLFEHARDVSYDRPAIVFIDEIDGIGATRRAEDSAGRETLEQLLVEMEGFLGPDSNVIVIGATNNYSHLDPALLQRLTRHIEMPEPDIAARELILRKYAARMPNLDPDVDFRLLARITIGLSGRALKNICNDAGLLSLRREAPTVTDAHFRDAVATVVMGQVRSGLQLTEEDRRLAAIHEAGHALVAVRLEYAAKPHHVTIVPRGKGEGSTWMVSDDHRHLTPRHVHDQMAVNMAGRAAEAVKLAEDAFSAAGADDDREKASDIAEHAVCGWGIGTERRLHVDVRHWQHHPFCEQIAEESNELVQAAEQRAIALIRENEDALDRLVERLLEVETLGGEEVVALVHGERPQAAPA